MIDELEQAGPRHELTPAERAYLEALFKESYRKLYSVAYRHLAGVCMYSVEDVIQETFLRACTNFYKMIQFDSPEAWLVAVCHNVAVDEAKRCMRLREFVDSTDHTNGCAVPDSLDEILPHDTLPEERDLLVRYYVHHDSTEEIARDLKLKPAAVRQRLVRAREKLKKKLRP